MATEEQISLIRQEIKVLEAEFPCPWKSGPGYTFTSWDQCEAYLPRVHSLADQAQKYDIQDCNIEVLAEVLFRCCW